MKSLEHIIREIREGKCECEKKKDSLEHAIRKVARKEYESSYAAKDSKPVDEGTDHSVYHVSWGPGLDHEVVARHGEEAVSKAKDALVAKTPKLKDPKYSDTFNKKPTVHNISKERNVQKEDVGGLVGSGTGGEEKLHAEDGKKKKDVKEAIGTLGTDKYQGSEFKSIRTATPHIKPPGPEHGHSQAPENASRQRSIAKEKAGINRVTEEEHLDEVAQFAAMAAPYIAPLIGATAAGVAGYMATKGKGKFPSFSSYDPEKAKQNDSYGTAAGRMKAMKFKPAEPVEAPPKTKPKHDEPVPGVIPDPSKPAKEPPAKPAEPEKAPAKPEEKPKTPPVTVPSPKPAEVPQEPPAKAIPAPKTPQPEIPPPLPAQTRPGKETKTTPKTPAPETPKELPSTKPVELPAIDIPGVKTKPEVKPETKPDVKTDVDTKPKVAQLPAIDIGTKTKTATTTDTKTATQTAVVPAAVTPKSAADAATTTPAEPSKPKFPGFMGTMALQDVFGGQKGITSKHPIASKARSHRRHVSEEVADKIRKKIENMPRKDAGDRKSIEYVGRSDADPKTAKEKTSRLATIKNVIDEAKKIKYEAESGKEKKFVYPNETEVVVGPNLKHNLLDVEDKKLPKDYENK